MSFAKEGIEWLANVFRQAIPQLQAQGDILRRHYYLLSDQMNSLAQGTTGWEGQASAVCQQLWEDLGPKLILQVAALNELSDALSSLASEFEHIHDNPSQAAYEMGLPVAGLSLGGTIAADGAIGAGIGAAEFLTAGLATIVVAGVVIFITEQQEEQNAITATQQVIAATTATAPGSVEEATRAVPTIANPTDEGRQGDSGRNSPKWPYYVIAAILAVGGVSAFIVAQLTPSQQQQAHDIAAKYNVSVTDVQRLLAAGFTEDQIVKLLKAGYTTSDMVILITAGCTPTQVVSYQAAGIPSSAITIVCQRIQQAQSSPTGKDQYGVAAADWPPILTRLTNLYGLIQTTQDKDTRAGYVLESKIILHLMPVLVNGHQDIIDRGSTYTDIDVETKCAIIDTTNSRNGKPDSIVKYLDPRANPSKKTIILYAPKYSHFGIPGIEAMGTNGITVVVIQNLTDLDQYLNDHPC